MCKQICQLFTCGHTSFQILPCTRPTNRLSHCIGTHCIFTPYPCTICIHAYDERINTFLSRTPKLLDIFENRIWAEALDFCDYVDHCCKVLTPNQRRLLSRATVRCLNLIDHVKELESKLRSLQTVRSARIQTLQLRYEVNPLGKFDIPGIEEELATLDRAIEGNLKKAGKFTDLHMVENRFWSPWKGQEIYGICWDAGHEWADAGMKNEKAFEANAISVEQ